MYQLVFLIHIPALFFYSETNEYDLHTKLLYGEFHNCFLLTLAPVSLLNTFVNEAWQAELCLRIRLESKL